MLNKDNFFTRILHVGVISGPVHNLPNKDTSDVVLKRVPVPQAEFGRRVVYEEGDALLLGAAAEVRPRLFAKLLPLHNVLLHIVHKRRTPGIDVSLELVHNRLCEEDLNFWTPFLDSSIPLDDPVVVGFAGLVDPVNVKFAQEVVVLEDFLGICITLFKELSVLLCAPFIFANGGIHAIKNTKYK